MILLSLIGEQPVPNLIPLWQSDHYSAMCFVVSDRTYSVAMQLAQVIENSEQLKQIKLLSPIRVDAYNLSKTRTRISEALSSYLLNDEAVCLNLTGGTKIMSLAAIQAALDTRIALIYVSTETNEIIHLRSDGSESHRETIRISISVEQYFYTQGFQISEHPNFNQLTGRPFAPEKQGDELEERVERLAKESGYFDDVRRGIFFRKFDGHSPVKNELDVLVTRNGRLAVCSCKSGRNVSNESIYELASLSSRESAGIYCGKVLVIDQNDVRENVRQRARESGVRLVFGSKIDKVSESLLIAAGGKRNEF